MQTQCACQYVKSCTGITIFHMEHRINSSLVCAQFCEVFSPFLSSFCVNLIKVESQSIFFAAPDRFDLIFSMCCLLRVSVLAQQPAPTETHMCRINRNQLNVQSNRLLVCAEYRLNWASGKIFDPPALAALLLRTN